MTKAACLLLLASLLIGAHAAPPATSGITVSQLDQLLSGKHPEGDGSLARELAGLKLAERVSLAQLTKWEAEISGDRSREALQALADGSAFLSPTPADMPATAPPDVETQQQILSLAIDYVKQMMPKLPDFYATRTTTSFEVTTPDQLAGQQDISQLLEKKQNNKFAHRVLGPAKSSGLPNGQLFSIGSIARVVTYRGGSEQANEDVGGDKQAAKPLFSLTSTGEFGPILNVILSEAPKESMAWDHWEQGPAGTLAVFRFAVPRDRSHFAVVEMMDNSPDFPAYHGEIAVDPADGSVFRITVVAQVRGSRSIVEASSLVDYGPVQIGDLNYVVPIHAVAMSRSYDPFANLDAQPPPVPAATSINDITFTNYHVFRAKSRIVTGATGP
jgi:hypothetical protein